jgi:hypothetical protein
LGLITLALSPSKDGRFCYARSGVNSITTQGGFTWER